MHEAVTWSAKPVCNISFFVVVVMRKSALVDLLVQ
jgi:hypothetical protein